MRIHVRLLVALMLLLCFTLLLCACDMDGVVDDVKGGVQDGINGVKDKVNEVKDKVSNMITTTSAPPTTTAPVTEAPPSAGMLYQKNPDGRSYTVKGHAGKDKDLVIAAEKDGLPVVAIMQAAFKGKSALSSIRIPESVLSIGKDAFSGCDGLIKAKNRGLYVDRWVVGSGDFIPDLVLEEDTFGIVDGAFAGRARLQTITLNASLRTIGAEAFVGCTALTGIVVPEENAYYTADGNALYTKDMTCLIRYFGTGEAFTVPASVTEIAPSAFRDNAALCTVTFEEGSALTVLGDHAFAGCTALTTFNVPNGVGKIGNGAFLGCTALISCNIPAESACTAIGTEAFRGCASLSTFTINEGITSIGQNAFYECRGLTAVYFAAPEGWHTERQEIPTFQLESSILAVSALRESYSINTWTRRTQ